jgi:hypothetical protein
MSMLFKEIFKIFAICHPDLSCTKIIALSVFLSPLVPLPFLCCRPTRRTLFLTAFRLHKARWQNGISLKQRSPSRPITPIRTITATLTFSPFLHHPPVCDIRWMHSGCRIAVRTTLYLCSNGVHFQKLR